MSYSCAEQYMMAKNTRIFQDHRAVKLIMSSPDPSTHKRIGRGVHNYDSAVGDWERINAVLSGTYAKFTQNPAMKNHNLSSDNNLPAESSPLGPVWGIGLQEEDPRTNNPSQMREKKMLGEALSAVRKAIRDRDTGSAHPASPSRSRTCTANAGAKRSRPRCGRAVNGGQRSQWSSFAFFALFFRRAGRLKAVKFGDNF